MESIQTSKIPRITVVTQARFESNNLFQPHYSTYQTKIRSKQANYYPLTINVTNQ